MYENFYDITVVEFKNVRKYRKGSAFQEWDVYLVKTTENKFVPCYVDGEFVHCGLSLKAVPFEEALDYAEFAIEFFAIIESLIY